MSKTPILPFLKWVGGKRNLTSTLIDLLPKEYDTYIEPFLGGGALFFALQPEKAVLSDSNEDLINTYLQVRDNCEALQYALKHLQEAYNSRELRLQQSLYKAFKDRYNYPEKYPAISTCDRAAYFIFLNKTCYSGMYRVNSSGKFNTPFGKYPQITLYNPAHLWQCAEALQAVSIRCREFYNVIPRAQEGDFVYCDPPYLPIDTLVFTNYTGKGFSAADHARLRICLTALTNKGVKWIQSNSIAPILYKCYGDCVIQEVTRTGSININTNSRQRVKELIIRNYE